MGLDGHEFSVMICLGVISFLSFPVHDVSSHVALITT
jgi:hypothetical protein